MATKSQIFFSHEHHNEKPVMNIWFKYDQQVINRLKKVISATWSFSKRYWHIRQSEFELKPFYEQLGDIANVYYSTLKVKPRTATLKSVSRDYSHRATTEFSINHLELQKQKHYKTIR